MKNKIELNVNLCAEAKKIIKENRKLMRETEKVLEEGRMLLDELHWNQDVRAAGGNPYMVPLTDVEGEYLPDDDLDDDDDDLDDDLDDDEDGDDLDDDEDEDNDEDDDDLDDEDEDNDEDPAAGSTSAGTEEHRSVRPFVAGNVKQLITYAKNHWTDLNVGDIVLRKNGMDWRLIHIRDSVLRDRQLVLMTDHVFDYIPFCKWNTDVDTNEYEKSYLKRRLNEYWAKHFFGVELEYIHEVKRLGKLWLLSGTEIGGESEPGTYQWFADPETMREHRKLKDMDGEPASYWLRSPHPGGANYVRRVRTDGLLYSNSAYYGIGAAAACVIEIS